MSKCPHNKTVYDDVLKVPICLQCGEMNPDKPKSLKERLKNNG